MKLGVLANAKYPGLPEILERVESKISDLALSVTHDGEILKLLDRKEAALEASWDEIDCLLTLGGDGTLLRGARQAGPRGVPVLGCNLGHLGFLTAAPLEELETALDRLDRGDYEEQERVTLSIRRIGGRTEAGQGSDGAAESPAAPGAAREETPPSASGERSFYALNDAVVHKSGFARLMTLRVWVGDEEVGQYSADGIVLSTATGSTAYSLSAGGPVLVPTLDAIVATPISPHTLAVRPVVLPADDKLRVEVVSKTEDAVLTIDGQVGSQLAPGDRIEAERSPHPVRLIQFPGQSFFSVLRQKLRWGDVRPRDEA